MSVNPILGQLVMGYSPMIDRERSPIATRLTVFPERREAAPDPQALLEVWPAPDGPITLSLRPLEVSGGAAAAPAVPTKATPLSLNIASEPWLRAMLALAPPPHVMIEVPAFMVSDPTHHAALRALHENGSVLIVKGRPVTELPRELLPCFRHSLIDVGEDRRGADSTPPSGTQRLITPIQVGVRTRAELDAAFARGAVATLGWPLEDEIAVHASKSAGADLAVVTELIKRVDAEEPVERLEAVLKNDPQLGFRLMRYLNSAAFGLAVEISSFQHAMMLLGYKKLKRWLALLLVSSSKDPAMKPAMFAAVRRGLLMEELVRGSGDDEMRGEVFICGVFSLLDRMLGQPFAELLESVPVPDRVRQALVDGTGPYQPYLALVKALEQGVRSDIREAADASFLGQAEINAALLRAMASARELD
ncbi:MAG: HDOD domain-containing protein [Rubrivivax sp.]